MIVLFFVSTKFVAQNSEINTRLQNGELKMTFPSIYFKHNSTEYAKMPYSVDSCFKYIAAKIKELNSYPVWRDLNEKERLTIMRIEKLKADIAKYVPSNKIQFQSMGSAQKISRHSISKANSTQAEHLITLNSVLDMSGALKNKEMGQKKQGHGFPRLVWCGWKRGFHWSSSGNRFEK